MTAKKKTKQTKMNIQISTSGLSHIAHLFKQQVREDMGQGYNNYPSPGNFEHNFANLVEVLVAYGRQDTNHLETNAVQNQSAEFAGVGRFVAHAEANGIKVPVELKTLVRNFDHDFPLDFWPRSRYCDPNIRNRSLNYRAWTTTKFHFEGI